MRTDPEMFNLIQLKYALMLEMKGLHHSKGSVYAHVKRRFGFKGNKASVLKQLVTYIDKEIKEREAALPGV